MSKREFGVPDFQANPYFLLFRFSVFIRHRIPERDQRGLPEEDALPGPEMSMSCWPTNGV